MPTGDPTDTPDPAAGSKRVCLITGAGGLLGSAFCRAYADRYDIVAVGRRRRPPVPSQYERFLDPLAPGRQVPANRDAVFVIDADLTADGEIARVADLAYARFGRVDLLVNNAATMRTHPPGLLDIEGSFADIDETFRLNVAVPTRLAVAVARHGWRDHTDDNRAANRNVVNVSSLSGHRVYPGGQAVYAASKAALNHMTRHLAAEFAGFGVRVNALAPTAFPHVIGTAEVAAGIVRLDEDDVTGKILVLDADPSPAASADDD